MSKQSKPKGELVIQIVAMPLDTNAKGKIFGGTLMSWMDMGSGVAARQQAQSQVVAVSVDNFAFLEPVSVGDTVSCYAALVKIGKTSMQYDMEAWKSSFLQIEPLKVAKGLFTLVAIDENGKPHAVNRSSIS